MEFEEIKSISDLDKISREVRWQNFEKLTAFIFEENGFNTKVNIVKVFNDKRRQYDVIAEKDDLSIIIDCKKWSGNRYRLSAIKDAVRKHKERCLLFNENAIPLIVTLVEEEVNVHDGVAIVPISKLNSYINEILMGPPRFELGTFTM